MMTGLLALFLLLPSNSKAVGLSVMEQTKTSANTVFIDTRNARVEISSQSYNGKVSNVGLYSSSNVVVSNTPGDNVVIYATGSIVAAGTILGGTNPLAMLVNSTDTVSGAKTFLSTVTLSGPVSISSRTVNLAGIDVSGSSVYKVATDTVAIYVSGNNPVEVSCQGTMSEIATNDGGCWSVLVDGGYIDGLSSTVGLGCQGFYAGSGWVTGVPMMTARFPGNLFSAATHKFGFIFRSGGGAQVNLGQENTTIVSTFHCWATEVH